jgi:transposase
MMLLRRKEKEKFVIKLAEEGKTTRDIAKEVHISLKDIGKIIRKATGDSDSQDEKGKRSLSPYARAFQMFKDKNPLADVAIELDIKTDMVLNFHADYLRLVRMDGLVKIYNELKNDFPLFFHLYRRIKKEGLSKGDIIELVGNPQDLKFLERRVELYNEHIGRQQLHKQQLEQVIDGLKSRIGNYDGISPL